MDTHRSISILASKIFHLVSKSLEVFNRLLDAAWWFKLLVIGIISISISLYYFRSPDCQSPNLSQDNIMSCAYDAPKYAEAGFRSIYRGSKVIWKGNISRLYSEKEYTDGDEIVSIITNYGARESAFATPALECETKWKNDRDISSYLKFLDSIPDRSEVYFSGDLVDLPPARMQLENCRILGRVEMFH